MKSQYTHITLVVDRSGSMLSIASDAQGGINQFVKDQKEQPGTASFYLTDFDTEHQELFGPADIQGFASYTLVPRGGTAMNDAIGKAIVKTGEFLDKLSEDDKPEKVLFCVVTDGQENSSLEWSPEKLRELISEHETKYSWVFQFIGANINAKTVGADLRISNTAQFQPTGASAGAVYANFSDTTSNFRGMKGAGGQSVYAAASAAVGPMSTDAEGNTVDEDGKIVRKKGEKVIPQSKVSTPSS